VKVLLKAIASNNYHQLSERATPRRSGGKYNVDAVTLLASRVDALAQRLAKWVTAQFQATLQGHRLVYVPFVRSVVCRSTHLLSATMVPLPLSMTMPYTALTHYHSTIHTPTLTVQSGKATQSPFIGTPTLNLRMPYSHLGSSTEPPTPLHHHHLHNLN